MKRMFAITLMMLVAASATSASADDLWVTYEGTEGPGKGKHIVLISGDEEYRSEEALPQLGKILATQHGFKCTVLFAIDPATGIINPNEQKNIPGLEALKTADLCIMSLRFRNLPDEQMKHIDDYLKRGGPVLGMRTTTHAFNMRGGNYAHYSNGYNGDKKAWKDGFGRLVVGEKWISHHGGHKRESTGGYIADGAKDHPILNGIKDRDVWGDTDVYGVRLPLPGDSKPLILGAVLTGMKPDDKVKEGKQNNPMMPVAWTKTYQIPDGKKGKCFNTTMGSSSDLVSDGTRRMIVNAAYWLVGLDVPKDGAKADIVGDFKWSKYSFHKGDYFIKQGVKPADHKLK